MSNNSIDNIISSYEFPLKKLAYYNMVRDSAKQVLDDRAGHRYASERSQAREAYQTALRMIEIYEKKISENDEINDTRLDYIQSMCSLEFDNDNDAKIRLQKLVDKFFHIMRVSRQEEPIWRTLTADGITPSEGDAEWYDLLFKQEVSPQYTRSYKISKLDKPNADLKRMVTSCKIVVDDLSTRVRLTYQDSPEEPMANTYVFYWMYGDECTELGEKLATSERDKLLFEKTDCMLPLGVGLTDEDGYLVQTRQIGRSMNKYQEIDLVNATFELYPGIIYGGWDTVSILKHNGYLDFDAAPVNDAKNFRAKMDNLKQARKKWLNTTYYEAELADKDPLEQLGANSGRGALPLLTAQARILHTYVSNGYFEDGQDATLENLTRAELSELKNSSTQYFYPDRRYGFFAYPVNRGSFKTKNLLALAEGEDSVAWCGEVDAENNVVALHCTLPEWDRRITLKLDALNFALYKTAEKVKPHAENIERLKGMSRLVQAQQKFPYGERSPEQIDIGEGLIDKIDSLSEAITEKINTADDEHEFLNQQEIDDIHNAAIALKELIFKEEFLAELHGYLVFAVNPEKDGYANAEGKLNPGPYMEEEPYWGHIIETLMQCVASISKTSLSKDIWLKWVEPMLDQFSNQPEVIRMIEELAEQEPFAEFTSAGKILEGRADDEEEPKPVEAYRLKFTKSLQGIQGSIEAKEQARLDKEALDLEHQNPLLWVMNCYKNVAAPLLHNMPGSPSVIAQVLNLYSDKIGHKMISNPAFNIKLNMALFRFSGVDMKITGQDLPKTFINKLATTGYIAQSPNSRAYKATIPKVKSADAKKLDFKIAMALAKLELKASRSLWYKSIMLLTTLGVQSYTFSEVYENFDSADRYTKAVTIFQATATVLYTTSLSSKLTGSMFSALTGMTFSISGNSTTRAISTMLGGEAAARYLAAISVLISITAANEQYALGNKSAGDWLIAQAISQIHVQLAYAAQKGIGRGALTAIAEGAAKRGIVVRVMQVGLTSLVAPLVGEVALCVSSVIALGMVGIEMGKGINSASKTSMYHMFDHHLQAISASTIPMLNDKYCHELYTSTQLPEGARGLLEDIKNISDGHLLDSKLIHDNGVWSDPDYVEDYKMGNLSWRAVVPLHLQGFSPESIRVMVELPGERLTETTMRDRQSRVTRAWIVQTIDDIISYYEYMVNPNSDPDLVGEGRNYLNKDDRLKISAALERGNFIPAAGHEQNLETVKDGRKHIISFDHLYFREGASDNGPSVKGVSWEDSNERSSQITNQFTI
jgi:hypothetical protein